MFLRREKSNRMNWAMDFWVRKGKPALFLAPMEGVTDYPMRTLLTELPGFTHTVTEFLRISQMVLPKKCYPRHARELKSGARTPTGVPVIFQLLGGNPERLAESAKLAVLSGAKAIDLNFGCPAPTVNRHDGGASLLKDPPRLEAIVHAVRNALPIEIPVSAKLRLGWDDPQTIYTTAAAAVRGGANWIAVHGRTKTQGYIPPAYWEPIGNLVKELPVPVIANGEIWALDDFLRCRDTTRAEHFMIGRGALANPHLAAEISYHLGLLAEKPSATPEPEEWRRYFLRFLELSLPLSSNPNYALKRLKQWLRYVEKQNHFPDFVSLKRLEEPQDFLHAITHCTPPSSLNL